MLTRIISGSTPLFLLLISLGFALGTAGIQILQTISYGSFHLAMLEVWTYPPLYGMLAVAAGCVMLLCLQPTATLRRHKILAATASIITVLCIMQATTGFLTQGFEAEKRQLVATLDQQKDITLNPLEIIFCQMVLEGGCLPPQGDL